MDRKDVKSRGWLLTLPADIYDRDFVETRLQKHRFTGQLERGGSTDTNPAGYLHWQIYLEANNAIRFSTLKGWFPKGHYEVRLGSKLQASLYVSKEDSRVGSAEEARIYNKELGAPDIDDRQGRRSDLEVYADMIEDGASVDDVLCAHPNAMRFVNHLRAYKGAVDKRSASGWRDITVRYLYGPTGVGKTRYVFETYGLDAYRVSNYKHPFDTYDGERVLVLDEFRGEIDFNYMLNITDGYPLQLRARYGDRVAMFNEVWVISNETIDTLYPEVQLNNPNSWSAFLRRFDYIQSWSEFTAVNNVSSLKAG